MNTPSFYCENCGREVSSGLESCPGCGQYFSSVRCPVCSFTGDTELFKEKCPKCGYAGEAESSSTLKAEQKKQFPSWFYKILIIILTVILLGLMRIYLIL